MPLLLHSNSTYLTDHSLWRECIEPKNVVQFNIGLFGTLMATSGLQALLCVIQMINGFFGCLCGTCNKKEVTLLHVVQISESKCFSHKLCYLRGFIYLLLFACLFLTYRNHSKIFTHTTPEALTATPCWKMVVFLAESA